MEAVHRQRIFSDGAYPAEGSTTNKWAPVSRTASLNENATHPDDVNLDGKRTQSGANSCAHLNTIGKGGGDPSKEKQKALSDLTAQGTVPETHEIGIIGDQATD
jgi:hypothetical protein